MQERGRVDEHDRAAEREEPGHVPALAVHPLEQGEAMVAELPHVAEAGRAGEDGDVVDLHGATAKGRSDQAAPAPSMLRAWRQSIPAGAAGEIAEAEGRPDHQVVVLEVGVPLDVVARVGVAVEAARLPDALGLGQARGRADEEPLVVDEIEAPHPHRLPDQLPDGPGHLLVARWVHPRDRGGDDPIAGGRRRHPHVPGRRQRMAQLELQGLAHDGQARAPGELVAESTQTHPLKQAWVLALVAHPDVRHGGEPRERAVSPVEEKHPRRVALQEGRLEAPGDRRRGSRRG